MLCFLQKRPECFSNRPVNCPRLAPFPPPRHLVVLACRFERSFYDVCADTCGIIASYIGPEAFSYLDATHLNIKHARGLPMMSRLILWQCNPKVSHVADLSLEAKPEISSCR
jgi:hypothetical protein